MPSRPTVSTSSDDGLRRSAAFSACGGYRYLLERRWRERTKADKTIVFIGLNPSTASAEIDDPTIRRCMRFSRDWGYERLLVVNLFALCTKSPSILKRHPDPIGRDNGRWLTEVARGGRRIVICWGRHGHWREQDLAFLARIERQCWCLGVNRDGSPVHPLYQPALTRLVRWPRHSSSSSR